MYEDDDNGVKDEDSVWYKDIHVNGDQTSRQSVSQSVRTEQQMQ